MARSILILLVAAVTATTVACGSAPDAAPTPPEVWDTGTCSLAHEPATRQCDAEHTDVMRCPSLEHQPHPDCVPSLTADAHVWCCPWAQ